MLEITLELGSALELEGLEQALEIYVEMERDRISDKHAGATERDRARLKAAEQLLKRVRG